MATWKLLDNDLDKSDDNRDEIERLIGWDWTNIDTVIDEIHNAFLGTDINDPNSNKDYRIIICEGDSWFDLVPIINHLKDQLEANDHLDKNIKRVIVNLAQSGDELCKITDNQLALFEQVLAYQPNNPNKRFEVECILLSAGGNDFLSKRNLRKVLKEPAQSSNNPEDYIDQNAWKNLQDAIRDDFKKIIKLRNKHTANTEIITHAYDYLCNFGKCIKFAGIPIAEMFSDCPWIESVMDEKLIPNGIRESIMKQIIDDNYDNLVKVAQQHNLFYVTDTREAITQGKNGWRDEIHPTDGASEQTAEVIYQLIRDEKLIDGIQ